MGERVWAVSCGQYSDYSVMALFATKKQAEDHATAVRGAADGFHRDAFVEPFPFFDRPPERVTVYSARAGVTADGRRHSCWGRFIIDDDGSAAPWDHIKAEEEWEYGYLYGPPARCKARTFTAGAWPGSVCVEVRGTDREAVVKALSDGMAEALRRHDENAAGAPGAGGTGAGT